MNLSNEGMCPNNSADLQCANDYKAISIKMIWWLQKIVPIDVKGEKYDDSSR